MIDFTKIAAQVEAGSIQALSIKQPYPHHIFHDGKDVENRDWPTRKRGWIIIHAGVSKSELADNQIHFPRGGIVGMARIVDCVEKMDSPWFFGAFGFVLADAFPVDLIPCKGMLGFFRPDAEALGRLAEILRTKAREVRHLAPDECPCPACRSDVEGIVPCRGGV